MAELPSPYTCDVCGVHKGEQNHWFRVWTFRGDITIAAWNHYPPDGARRSELPTKQFHCCGEEHALRKAGELLAKLKATSNERTTPMESAD